MTVSLLLLLSSVLLISSTYQANVVTAKRCTDESASYDESTSFSSSSCNSQNSNSFTHFQSGNDGNEVIPLKHTKKYFNHESHDGDSENDTPFTLPFP